MSQKIFLAGREGLLASYARLHLGETGYTFVIDRLVNVAAKPCDRFDFDSAAPILFPNLGNRDWGAVYQMLFAQSFNGGVRTVALGPIGAPIRIPFVSSKNSISGAPVNLGCMQCAATKPNLPTLLTGRSIPMSSFSPTGSSRLSSRMREGQATRRAGSLRGIACFIFDVVHVCAKATCSERQLRQQAHRTRDIVTYYSNRRNAALERSWTTASTCTEMPDRGRQCNEWIWK